ncbi:MAG TPA: MFS transporter [Arsenicitalea sp.]|jgi:PPP family 3-phenylpropionic acid transporter|nr:MFS transporter [Arsenicitalea sp.]
MPQTGVFERVTPELRTSFFYFTQLTTLGCGVVYAGIWFAQKGIHSEQIAVINAVPVLIMLVLNLVVGRIADRASDWRQVIVIGSLVAGLVPVGLFFVNEFWGILAVWTLTALPTSAIAPVADAATMRMTRRNGSSFGGIRAWGTIGYIAAVGATSLIVAHFGPMSFVPLYVGLALLRAFASLLLPQFRAPVREAVVSVKGVASRLREVMKPWFVLPLVGYAMVYGTHLILNAFAALLWKRQGISEDVIGPLIMLGAVAEASMMFGWRRFGSKVSPRNLLLLSAVVSAFRWTAMGFAPPVIVLVFLQLLHSITFALGYLGCVHFIARWTSEDIAAEAQSFYVVLQQAMSVIALVGFGWLVPVLGEHAYFVAAGFALLGAALILISLRMRQPETHAASEKVRVAIS